MDGNLEGVIFLLDKKGNFNLSPDVSTLNNAAASENIFLVKFLIKYYKLVPTQETLSKASEKNIVALYLLNPNNGFNLTTFTYDKSHVNKCHFIFQDAFTKLKSNEFDSQSFIKAFSLHSEHFFRLVEKGLQNLPEELNDAFQSFLALDIVRATYLPISQHKLVMLAEKGNIKMSEEEKNILLQKLNLVLKF